MAHPIYQVRAVEIVAPYTLRVQFTDNAEQVIDFRPILAGELYGPLLDAQMFNRVSIDPEVKTLVWPNGADFDPATMIGLNIEKPLRLAPGNGNASLSNYSHQILSEW